MPSHFDVLHAANAGSAASYYWEWDNALQRHVLAHTTTDDSTAHSGERREGPHDDSELARRAARGDMLAFEALYRRHAGRVLAVCLRLTGER